MTLEELERSLPNGLHDAELLNVRIDYAAQTAALELNIDVSALTDIEQAYRTGRVMFSGVQFVIIDAPRVDKGYVGISAIDTGSGQPRTAPCQLPDVPEDCFLCWVFIIRLNSFLRIAARDASHEWIESTPIKQERKCP